MKHHTDEHYTPLQALAGLLIASAAIGVTVAGMYHASKDADRVTQEPQQSEITTFKNWLFRRST
jgi:hypothetical protein